jgi:hypothetical protein
VLETLPEIVNLDSRLTSIPPNHFSSFAEVLLIVGEHDEVVEGGSYGRSPRGRSAELGLLMTEGAFPSLLT